MARSNRICEYRLRGSPTVCEVPILHVSYHLCISIAPQTTSSGRAARGTFHTPAVCHIKGQQIATPSIVTKYVFVTTL
jgi:hypothetical protein